MRIKHYPQLFRDRLHALLSSWATAQGLPSKIERLNAYATLHPRPFLAVVFGILLVSFLFTLVFSFSSRDDSSHDMSASISRIEDLSPIISGKQQIEEIKQSQANDMKSVLLQGQQIKREVDSLMKLPTKSHLDSLEIYRKHKQLEIIVRHLNEKD